MNHGPGNLAKLENLQRFYTRRMNNSQDMDYWERLKVCQMLSQERRMERYKIIYIWKILEGRVPNCGIDQMENLRLGRLCRIQPINRCKSRIQTLRENSFQVVGPRLFNSIPANIRNLSKCSIDDFKAALDKYLARIPDEPKIPGYVPTASDQFSGQPSNSLVDQIRKHNQTNTGGG